MRDLSGRFAFLIWARASLQSVIHSNPDNKSTEINEADEFTIFVSV